MADLIVGDEECSFADIVVELMLAKGFSELRGKWKSLATLLKLEKGEIDEIEHSTRFDFQLSDVISTILLKWRNRQASEAKLGVLVKCLKAIGFNDGVFALTKKYKILDDSNKDESKPPDSLHTSLNKPSRKGKETVDGNMFGRQKEYVDDLIPHEVLLPILPMEFSDDTYGLPIDNKGLAMVINFIQYKHGDNRDEGVMDTQYAKSLFAGLGYETDDIHEVKECNFNKINFGNIIDDFKIKLCRHFKTIYEEAKATSFVVFLGGHGKEGKIQLPDSTYIDIMDDVVKTLCSTPEEFVSNENGDYKQRWDKMPKIFFVQACRPLLDSSEEPANCIISYSCKSGQASRRHPNGGTYYWRTVTEVFRRTARDSHLTTMLDEVRITVASDVRREGSEQEPEWKAPSGFGTLYFNLPTQRGS